MSKLLKVSLGAAVAVALLAGVAVSSASALTQAEANAIISALGLTGSNAAVINALVTGGSTSGACALKSAPDMTVGSTGANVVELQDYLIGKGLLTMPAGVSKGYFGSLTQSALAAYQMSMGISPASGYFGPITRGSIVCSDTSDDSDDNTDSDLSGNAGSISDADFLSALNNEEVGEDEEDVEVAGLEIEADEGSDINLIAVTIDFDHTSSGSGSDDDFEDYASEVSVLFNGEEVARMDANEFDDDNNYQKTIGLDEDAIIEADGTGELVVAVSAVSNLDSNNQAETWTAEFVSVRFEDAQGAIITESSQGDIGAGDARTFSFESFASASDIEFKIQNGDDEINEARVIDIDDNDETENVAVFSFDIKVTGADVTLKDLLATSTITGTANTLDDIFSKLTLEIDGEEVGSENPTASTTVLFDDIDVDLEVGTYEAIIYGDIQATSSAVVAVGDTFMFQVGENQTDDTRFDVEDENGDNLADADKVGTETGEAHTLQVDGISASLVSKGATSVDVDSTDNDRAELTIVFEVTNFGEDTLYIPNVVTYKGSTSTETRTAPSTSQGIGFTVQMDSATTSINSLNISTTLESDATLGTNAYEVESGDSEEFELTVKVTNKTTAVIDGVSVRALLSGIGWADTDSATSDSVYTVDLTTFESDWAVVAD
jgi:peptidoglycan hydrolase-like protein with peptidoglycan-binding domain